MKSNVIQPVFLANADDPLPRGNVRGRKPGQRKDATLEGAAQKGFAPVDGEQPVGRGGNFAQAEGDHPLVVSPITGQPHRQTLERRAELVPHGRSFSQGHLEFRLAAGLVPLRGDRLSADVESAAASLTA